MISHKWKKQLNCLVLTVSILSRHTYLTKSRVFNDMQAILQYLPSPLELYTPRRFDQEQGGLGRHPTL
jgi:hypothetical protein